MPAPGLADPRTGYRSAQDLVYTPSSSQAPCALRGADGRTVGGSTDDYLLFFVTWDYGAERGHSSSSWSWRSCRCQKSSRFPGQSSTAYSGADFPAATAEQNVDIPVPRGDRTLHPASSSSVLPVTANQGVFNTFPRGKKSARSGSHSGSELLPESSSSTPALLHEGFWEDDAGGMWMQFPSGWWKLLGSDPEVWRPG